MNHYLTALVALMICAMPPASAVTVHTWTDAEGVVHYGDTPPTTASDVRTIELEDLSSPGNADDYSVVRQWERVREARDRKDALALERERLRAEQRAQAAPPVVVVEPGWRPVIYPGFNPYRGRGGGYGFGSGHGPRPSQREAYNDRRRRSGFAPQGVPAWPNR